MSGPDFFVFDGISYPVVEGTWQEDVLLPGARQRTETGVLRSVRAGTPKSNFRGECHFQTRAAADAFREAANEEGDHTVSGWGPGREVVCESEAGTVVPIGHRPPGQDATAHYRVRFALYETGEDEDAES